MLAPAISVTEEVAPECLASLNALLKSSRIFKCAKYNPSKRTEEKKAEDKKANHVSIELRLRKVNATMRDVKRIAVGFPCRFAARKLNDATSASRHTRERVSHLTLATRTPVVATEADFGRVGLTLTEQDKEGRGIRCFHFHNYTIDLYISQELFLFV